MRDLNFGPILYLALLGAATLTIGVAAALFFATRWLLRLCF